MDETYIKVLGPWKYLYRAVDKEGRTIDFLLRAKRDKTVGTRFFKKAMRQNGEPDKVTLDKSGANKAAMNPINQDRDESIEVRQIKYLNNISEQDHRAVKRITSPMLGFKSFWSAQKLIAGIETMHMVKKGQLHCPGGQAMSAAGQFYSLAF